ncbi:MAG TPA: hemerythrin domain-containing protein [Polyangiaceae bacterium]
MSSNHPLPLHFGRVTAIANDHMRMNPMFARLTELAASLSKSDGPALSSLKEHVERLLPIVSRHFSAEESNSYFGVLMAEHPTACSAVAELCSEHAEMLALLEHLRAGCSVEPEPALAERQALANRVLALCEQFRAHEQKESALMQAFLLGTE